MRAPADPSLRPRAGRPRRRSCVARPVPPRRANARRRARPAVEAASSGRRAGWPRCAAGRPVRRPSPCRRSRPSRSSRWRPL